MSQQNENEFDGEEDDEETSEEMELSLSPDVLRKELRGFEQVLIYALKLKSLTGDMLERIEELDAEGKTQESDPQMKELIEEYMKCVAPESVFHLVDFAVAGIRMLGTASSFMEHMTVDDDEDDGEAESVEDPKDLY